MFGRYLFNLARVDSADFVKNVVRSGNYQNTVYRCLRNLSRSPDYNDKDYVGFTLYGTIIESQLTKSFIVKTRDGRNYHLRHAIIRPLSMEIQRTMNGIATMLGAEAIGMPIRTGGIQLSTTLSPNPYRECPLSLFNSALVLTATAQPTHQRGLAIPLRSQTCRFLPIVLEVERSTARPMKRIAGRRSRTRLQPASVSLTIIVSSLTLPDDRAHSNYIQFPSMILGPRFAKGIILVATRKLLELLNPGARVRFPRTHTYARITSPVVVLIRTQSTRTLVSS